MRTPSSCASPTGSIAPELLPQLLDPFRRGQGEPSDGDGRGLGLYTVQQIVQAHGGRITAGDAGSGRTCFLTDLPRVPVESFQC